ncbi:MAG: histidine--tRNA ligase, partial [Bacteroidales bacterium]|nr:histidine--tRNA ligase [Bacteroidales bacterium]
QFSYADDRKIAFVAIAGENEMNEGKINIKNMQSGEQCVLAKEELLAYLQSAIN